MTKDGCREAVLHAVREHDAGNDESLDLMAALLEEQDRAKNRLRELGYGVTGTPWSQMIDAIPSGWRQ